MLKIDDKNWLQNLIARLDQPQKTWLAGYVTGLLEAGTAPDLAASASLMPSINLFYATETGNSKAVATGLLQTFKNAGFKAKAISVNRLKTKDLLTTPLALFIASTQGEGDPPEAAKAFFAHLAGETGTPLADLSFAVLGLGDKSYTHFCGAALTLDQHLQRLGAKSLHSPQLLDVDYAAHIHPWAEQILPLLGPGGGQSIPRTAAVAAPVHTRGYSRLEPIKGEIIEHVNLNDIGSDKQTYHLEITLPDDVVYTPGDAIGILVPDGKAMPPRLYSISSSALAHPGQVHITVALASHTNPDGTTGYGVTSHYLSGLQQGDGLEFYVHQNHMFTLPPDDQDLIMIGPGTGIAPFRAFVHERAERGASGRNWLFFGDRRAHCDFLYQAEWQDFLASGVLTKLDLAFSRDQPEKIYVQHRLQQQAGQIMAWLDGGAAIYVCGAKDPMSIDVDKTLLALLQQQKGLSIQAAQDMLDDLVEQGRYVKDVY